MIVIDMDMPRGCNDCKVNCISQTRKLDSPCPIKCDIEDIKTEIAEYKDDKVIHAERNEMINIVLDLIDKHIK